MLKVWVEERQVAQSNYHAKISVNPYHKINCYNVSSQIKVSNMIKGHKHFHLC
jgi:hypothetical protein